MKAIVAILALAGLVPSAVSSAQIKSADVGKLRETLMISLEVREGGGDFTDWVREASIETGALVRQFRWRTSLAGAAGARFEVVHGAFPASPVPGTPINLKLDGHLKLPQKAGAYGIFTIDFTPVLQASVGTSKPAELVTFHVRVIPLDKQNKPLSVASTPVKITYAPPADGTIFSGSSMVVRLQEVRCVTVTKGGGADELDVTVIAFPRFGGQAQTVYWKSHKMNNGTAFHPSKLLWTFEGLSFKLDVDLIVVLQEDDAGNAFQSGIAPPANNPAFDENLLQAACTGDHDCIGLPQTLPVTAADWHKVAVEKQTVTRTLTFTGKYFLVLKGKSELMDLGGHYEVTFQLAPK